MAEFALVIAQRSTHLYRLGRAAAQHVATAGAQDDPLPWISQHMPARSNCSLVSNTIDESYVQSNLPPIWRPDTRWQLLQRRLTQQVRDTPYRVAVLAPSGTWRPPTRASLIGIGQSQRIDEWLDALAVRQVRVKGLWPMSALIALAIDRKVPTSPQTDRAQAQVLAEPARLRPTLILVATAAGLRQVLVRGKTPLFSRMPLMNANDDTLSLADVLTEARRTAQYLISQGWISSADQPVATQIWLPFDDPQALTELSNNPTLDLQSIKVVTDPYARLLPQLKSAATQFQCLPKEARTSWRAAQIASNSKIVGVTALALSGLWSVPLLWESLDKRSLAQEQLARVPGINQQASQEALRSKGNLSQIGLAMVTVQAWKQSIVIQADQFAAMQHLASALKAAPGVEVHKIHWELPRLPAETTGSTSAEPVRPFECPKAQARAVAGASTAPAPATATANPPVALLTLTAAFPQELTKREALQIQDSLLAGLNAGGWSVFITKSAVNFDPTQSQAGTLGEKGAHTLELCLQKAAP